MDQKIDIQEDTKQKEEVLQDLVDSCLDQIQNIVTED